MRTFALTLKLFGPQNFKIVFSMDNIQQIADAVQKDL